MFKNTPFTKLKPISGKATGFYGNGSSRPPLLNSEGLQYLVGNDGRNAIDQLGNVVPTVEVCDVACLDFTGVTGGGIVDSRIVGDETVLEFIGSGTTPTISAGRINCADGCKLGQIKLSNNIWFVAESTTGNICYDANGKSLFNTTEMVNDLEMVDYLEVLV